MVQIKKMSGYFSKMKKNKNTGENNPILYLCWSLFSFTMFVFKQSSFDPIETYETKFCREKKATIKTKQKQHLEY